MKKLLFVLLIGLWLFTACVPQSTPTSAPVAQPTAKSSEIKVTDALGRTVVLPKPPKRIVLTGKAVIMVVNAAYIFPEALTNLAAIGSQNQSPATFVPLIDPNYSAKATLQQDAGAEQIAAIQPDLVILKSSLSETLGKPLDALKIPVLFVDFETPEQYERDIAILGTVFQNEARAKEINAYYRNKVDEISAKVKGLSTKPKTLLLYFSEKDGAVAFNVPPLAWMQTKLVQIAGGEPVWAAANPVSGWTKVSLEQVAAWDADKIFIISYTKNAVDVVKSLKADTQWQALRAVKQGQLHAFPADLYSWDQPDTRWVLGLTWLATKLHPDVFAKTDIIGQAKEFYKTLYRQDEAFFEKNIRPTLKGDLP